MEPADFEQPELHEFFVHDADEENKPRDEDVVGKDPGDFGSPDVSRARSEDLDDFFRVSEMLVQQIGRNAMKYLPEAHKQRPSCVGEEPRAAVYGFELTSLAPRQPIKIEPMRYGSLDVRPKTSNIERNELRSGLPQTVANRIVKYSFGSLAKIEMKSHETLLRLLSCVIWIVGLFSGAQSHLRPRCLERRIGSFRDTVRRSFYLERTYIRGYTDPLFLCLLSLLPYFLITVGEFTLFLSLSTPKLAELVKVYDYRIFYIGYLGFTQLYRRLDIKQRLQAGFDCFSTFGETVPNVCRKAKRAMKGYKNQKLRRLVVNIPADIKKYSNMSSAEEGVTTAYQHAATQTAGSGIEESLFCRCIMCPAWPALQNLFMLVSSRLGEDEGSLTVMMQRQTKLSLVSIIQLCTVTQPLLEYGLRFIDCDGCLQSDDLGIQVILEIIDDQKLPSFPKLRGLILRLLKIGMARAGQFMNMIKSDLTVSVWQVADLTFVNGSYPRTTHEGSSFGGSYRAWVKSSDQIAASNALNSQGYSVAQSCGEAPHLSQRERACFTNSSTGQ